MTKAEIEMELSKNPDLLKLSEAFIDLDKSNPEIVNRIAEKVKAGTPLAQAVQEV